MIQTPVSPSTSPVNTPTTLCRFHSTLAAGLLKCQINYPARNPKVSRIGLLTFGTVQVRKQFFIYILLTVHLITVFVNNQLDAQFFFLYLFIPILYMFRTTKCSSSGQPIVSIWPLVYVTVCRWPCGMQVWMELNLHTTRSPAYSDVYQRGRIDTIDSADDEHLVVRNM